MPSKKMNQTVALEEALVPLCRVLLESGITAVEFQLAIGKAAVVAAQESARLKNGKINQSRVAMMTGFSRTEIRRLLANDGEKKGGQKYFGVKRLVDGWSRDAEFSTRTGKRRALPIRGGYGSFQSLCKRYSGDIPFKAALDELVRLGLVRKAKASVSFVDSRRALLRPAGPDVLELLGKQIASVIGVRANVDTGSELVAEDQIEVRISVPSVREIAKDRARQGVRAFMSGLANTLQPFASERELPTKENQRSLRVKVSIELLKAGAV